MIISIVNIIINLITMFVFGKLSYNYGFTKSGILEVSEPNFNFQSPYLWTIILDLILLIALLCFKNKLSKEQMKIISFLLSIYNLVTIVVLFAFVL